MTKVVFGGLDPDDAEYMARLTYRGQYNLQRAKERLYRPAAVRSRQVWLDQTSESESHGSTTGQSWSSGHSTTESEAKTRNQSFSVNRTDTTSWADSHTDSSSVASIDTSTEGESRSTATVSTPGSFFEPEQIITVSAGEGTNSSRTTGTVTTTGSSDTHSKGGSASVGTAKTRGIATTKGVAKTTSSEVGGSTAQSVSRGTTRGRSEGYITEYKDLPGPLWELADQIHVKSVLLAHLKIGHAVVRVANQRPVQVVLPYVGDQSVRPGRVADARREILLTTPFVAPAELVDAEYATHRQMLIEASKPPEPDAPTTPAPEGAGDPAEPPVAPLEWK